MSADTIYHPGKMFIVPRLFLATCLCKCHRLRVAWGRSAAFRGGLAISPRTQSCRRRLSHEGGGKAGTPKILREQSLFAEAAGIIACSHESSNRLRCHGLQHQLIGMSSRTRFTDHPASTLKPDASHLYDALGLRRL